ncbi:MAG: hypothetical protein GF401_14880 [Chitinivibrionales bacterium]|nr:hypothetical protein [Chitinivibrionales bacterium]
MGKDISVGLAALTGYSNFFLSALLDRTVSSVTFAGAISINPNECIRLQELKDRRIRIFSSFEAFYDNLSVDLMIIPTPIQYYVPHTCFALEQGSNVLCEKPICGVVQGIQTMKNVRDRTGKLVAIGYQWSFSRAIQALKQDVLKGVFGAPKSLKA